MTGVLDVKLDEVLSSARIAGSAHGSFKHKRLTVKARSLKKEELITLEMAVTRAACACDRVFAGFLCFLVFARFRFGDATRMSGLPSRDQDDDGRTDYLEGSAEVLKTGQHGRRLRTALPVVAPALGVSGENWGERWLNECERISFSGEHGLITTPAGDGESFVVAPLTAHEASIWMREILQQGGHESAEVLSLIHI